ncbi:hypothetical protein C2845_PM08G20340 [Panicum miliaceum]|uniref:Uncharacterized protein n=1 Tax=Panicum miliaceum TaxID=4540 RepID=A0A3L6QWH5_PANMI|nr:hypothetical protein C2845_PM08G20340 [Panicum miliaceum]
MVEQRCPILHTAGSGFHEQRENIHVRIPPPQNAYGQRLLQKLLLPNPPSSPNTVEDEFGSYILQRTEESEKATQLR